MDEVTGRTVMEGENVVSIPLLPLPNLLLVPGQTLPMHIFNPQVYINAFPQFSVYRLCSSGTIGMSSGPSDS
jgi:hypothetical protein